VSAALVARDTAKGLNMSINAYLSIIGMPKSTYYWGIKHSKDADSDASVKAAITKILSDKRNRVYGSRRIVIALARMGIRVSRNKVRRILRHIGYRASFGSGRYNSYRGNVGKICPNLLMNRDFKAPEMGLKMGTDVTEFKLPFGKVYLSPVIDFCNGMVVCHSISKHPNFDQTLDMLNKLEKAGIIRRGETILHSDQGWQYQMKPYQAWLSDHGIRQSMSRKGNCLDNSMTENFFGLLKKEMFYGHEYDYKDYDSFVKALDEYIVWYNHNRIKLRLLMSPSQYEETFKS